MPRRRVCRSGAIRDAVLVALTALGSLELSGHLSAAVATPSLPQSAPDARRRVTMWFMAGQGRALEALELNIRDFQAAYPRYEVDLTLVPQGGSTEAIRVAGASGDLPCLLFLDGPTVPYFTSLGYLRPLDRFLSAELRADLLPSVLAQGTVAGRLYALAVYESGLGIFANRRYLADARVRIPTIDHPWTLAEFEEALQKLTALPEVVHALDLKINYGRGEFFTFAFAPLLQSFGGNLLNRRTRVARGTLDGPQSVAAMRRLQRWLERGWADPRPSDDDAFTSRRAALSWVGHWAYTRYADALGDDLVLLPMPDFGRGPKTGTGAWTFSISSTCTNVEGAWALLRFSLGRAQMLRWTAMHPAVPARRSVMLASPLHRPGGPLHLYVQQHERRWAAERPSTPGYAVITAAFAEAVDGIVKGADAQLELSRAAARIDRDFAKHGGYR